MKKPCHSIVLAGICASVLGIGHAVAQSGQPAMQQDTTTLSDDYRWSRTSGFYLGADAGGALTSDTRVKEFFGPVDPGTKVRLDPGVRFGVVGGYKFNQWFGLEGETGVIANNIKSITGATIDGNADLANVPFLLNARFELPHGHCPVTPYFGGGAGGAASVISMDRHIELNDVRLSGNDAALVFAYQAFAGLRYAITDRIGLGLEYHYFATTGPTWRADASGTDTDHLRFLGVQSHTISVAFDFRF
ncbi:MAG TPA: porin family protein [Verrucomicrobiae bacterium]|jgi:opacity protein-like surface antigen|nr:porin family protein [Verrucomicrobiae bacterium]